MSRLYNADAAVLCPFYKGETAKTVICEGLDASMSSTANGFHYESRKATYKTAFCCAGWNRCALAKALNSKYE